MYEIPLQNKIIQNCWFQEMFVFNLNNDLLNMLKNSINSIYVFPLFQSENIRK